MDILRKEINEFYERQHLAGEMLDYSILDDCRKIIGLIVGVECDCRVITDASRDYCYIWGGNLARLMGLTESGDYFTEMNSSDEDEIYNRIHPEDLVDKRMLEYEFFKFVDERPGTLKLNYRATSRLRLRDRWGKYICVDNTTRVLRLSPAGKVWLILCHYAISPVQDVSDGIIPRIVNSFTGEIIELHLSDRRARILTEREKEILNLIKGGKLSKQIAGELGISVHTVNRHRQNILEKLSVGNSVEAVMAATVMKLL